MLGPNAFLWAAITSPGLAIIDVDVELVTEGALVWGEEGGGSSKPVVERHVQAEIRAIVSQCPYSEVAHTSYAEDGRTKASGLLSRRTG